MPLDHSFIGREYPPTHPWEVGREKIREFAESIGDGNELYRDPAAARDAGYSDVIAPPTFAVLLWQRASQVLIDDPQLGLDFSRVVHGQQRFTHHRPIQAGDRLVVVAHVDDITTRAGNDFLAVRAEIAGVTGEAVCTARATLVVRGIGEDESTATPAGKSGGAAETAEGSAR